jgi:hypothetical protein
LGFKEGWVGYVGRTQLLDHQGRNNNRPEENKALALSSSDLSSHQDTGGAISQYPENKC